MLQDTYISRSDLFLLLAQHYEVEKENKNTNNSKYININNVMRRAIRMKEQQNQPHNILVAM